MSVQTLRNRAVNVHELTAAIFPLTGLDSGAERSVLVLSRAG